MKGERNRGRERVTVREKECMTKNESQIVISINLKFELEFLCNKMQCMFSETELLIQNVTHRRNKKGKKARYWQCEKLT